MKKFLKEKFLAVWGTCSDSARTGVLIAVSAACLWFLGAKLSGAQDFIAAGVVSLTIAGTLGYWIDRCCFKDSRPHMLSWKQYKPRMFVEARRLIIIMWCMYAIPNWFAL